MGNADCTKTLQQALTTKNTNYTRPQLHPPPPRWAIISSPRHTTAPRRAGRARPMVSRHLHTQSNRKQRRIQTSTPTKSKHAQTQIQTNKWRSSQRHDCVILIEAQLTSWTKRTCGVQTHTSLIAHMCVAVNKVTALYGRPVVVDVWVCVCVCACGHITLTLWMPFKYLRIYWWRARGNKRLLLGHRIRWSPTAPQSARWSVSLCMCVCAFVRWNEFSLTLSRFNLKLRNISANFGGELANKLDMVIEPRDGGELCWQMWLFS